MTKIQLVGTILLICFPGLIFIIRNLEHSFRITDTTIKEEALEWKSTIVQEPYNDNDDKKTILLTGGAGFIGSHVAERLIERGDHVIIIDNLNDMYNVELKHQNLEIIQSKANNEQQQFTFYHGDICNQTLLQEIFEKHKPKWICHLAARAGVRLSIADPMEYVRSNIEGTTKLLEMASAQDRNVKNFVFASSSSVYGGGGSTSTTATSQSNDPKKDKIAFQESQLVNRPWSPYAATKASTELLAYTYHHLYDHLHLTGLRFFTVYGPRGRPDMAPYMFIDRISRGESIKQFGNGDAVRDYTYVSDIVDGVIRALDRPYKFEIFNLGRGDGIVLKDFIHLVETNVGKKAKVDILPVQEGDVPFTTADISKAKYLLGYDPQVSFADGINRTVSWYQTTYGKDGERAPV